MNTSTTNQTATVQKVISELGHDIAARQDMTSKEMATTIFNPNIEKDIASKDEKFQEAVKNLTHSVFQELTENEQVSEIFNILVTIEKQCGFENFVMKTLLSYSFKYASEVI